MHAFVCRLASITLALLLAAGTARAGDVYVQTNLVSNNQSLATAADRPELAGCLGAVLLNEQPILDLRPGCQLQWVGATTVYKVSDTQPPSQPPVRC